MEAVERAVAQDKEERARAQMGEPSRSYVRLPSKEFDELLTLAGAPRKLLEKKFRGHLDRLKQLGYEFFSQEGAGERNDRPTEIVVISKASVVQYAKSEIELIRKKDVEHQQKSRAVKKNTR